MILPRPDLFAAQATGTLDGSSTQISTQISSSLSQTSSFTSTTTSSASSSNSDTLSSSILSSSDPLSQQCSVVTLQEGATLVLSNARRIVLGHNVIYIPSCAVDSDPDLNSTSTLIGRVPFYASVTPQVYATAAATFLSWMLVALLVITPRTFSVGGAIHYAGFRDRSGLIGGATGGASVIGVGSRPWLQKMAALTVAISMTVVTADTFRFVKGQYDHGYIDGAAMHTAVVNSVEIKATRVISDIFIWLAQVQTLIRLFPRHRAKVIIKWAGFCFIIIDSTLTCLSTILGNPIGRPDSFADTIPTVNYFFQLALSVIYACLVIYYAFTKRRYAFYHSMMWNISLIAFLSLVAIFTPIGFFITDITDSSVAIWGDYFRWAGAAASSVIVWEWVERIEALEREEKKDGILGREVFDNDEMLVVRDSGFDASPPDDDEKSRRLFGVRLRSLRRDNPLPALSSSFNPHNMIRAYRRKRRRPRNTATGSTVANLSEQHLRNLDETASSNQPSSRSTFHRPPPAATVRSMSTGVTETTGSTPTSTTNSGTEPSILNHSHSTTRSRDEYVLHPRTISFSDSLTRPNDQPTSPPLPSHPHSPSQALYGPSIPSISENGITTPPSSHLPPRHNTEAPQSPSSFPPFDAP